MPQKDPLRWGQYLASDRVFLAQETTVRSTTSNTSPEPGDRGGEEGFWEVVL